MSGFSLPVPSQLLHHICLPFPNRTHVSPTLPVWPRPRLPTFLSPPIFQLPLCWSLRLGPSAARMARRPSRPPWWRPEGRAGSSVSVPRLLAVVLLARIWSSPWRSGLLASSPRRPSRSGHSGCGHHRPPPAGSSRMPAGSGHSPNDADFDPPTSPCVRSPLLPPSSSTRQVNCSVSGWYPWDCVDGSQPGDTNSVASAVSRYEGLHKSREPDPALVSALSLSQHGW